MYSGGSGLSIDIHFVDIELSYDVLSPLPTLLSKPFNHPHPYIEIATAISVVQRIVLGLFNNYNIMSLKRRYLYIVHVPVICMNDVMSIFWISTFQTYHLLLYKEILHFIAAPYKNTMLVLVIHGIQAIPLVKTHFVQ